MSAYIKIRLGLSLLLALAVLLPGIAVTGSAQAAPNSLPASAKIADMPVFAQQHTLSCEFSATRAAVARWGVNLSEADFINNIPFNANPHIGFRGDINGWFGGTDDYGIYAEPIALYLSTIGFNTKLISGGVDEVKGEISKGRPVVFWAPAGMGWGNVYTSSYEGLDFKLMPYEHAMTLYGYDDRGVYVADPGYGTYDYYSWDSFIRSWGYLGQMAMSVWPASQGFAADETPGISPYFYRQWINDGGLSVYGYPISAPETKNGVTTQYFERSRMEYNLNGPRNQTIGLGLLGRELTSQRTNNFYFRPVAKPASTDNLWYFDDTGHTLGGAFLNYWRNNGWLALFGYPISEPFVENNRLVQYFERARFELVPGTSDQIELGLLGRDALQKQRARQLSSMYGTIRF